MLSLADALNHWLQQNWPTLFACQINPDDPSIVWIARKGENFLLLAIDLDTNEAIPNYAGDGMNYCSDNPMKIFSPADQRFLDRIDDCLIRCCAGKDLRRKT